MTEPSPTGTPLQISGGTGVALSLVVSLVTGAFSSGITCGVMTRLERDILTVQAELKDSAAVQHSQELKLVTLEGELRAIREGVAEIKAALRKLTEELRPSAHARP